LKQLLQDNALREIIRVCKSSGISRLSLDNFQLEFSPTRPQAAATHANPPVETATDAGVRLQNQELIAELDHSQQMIDDPLAYEQRVIDEHLRGGNESESGPGEAQSALQ
jgi:hypothetical protein